MRRLVEWMRLQWALLVAEWFAEDSCEHPVRSLRLDGIWHEMEPPEAAVTCVRCNRSFSIQLKGSFAESVRQRYEIGHAEQREAHRRAIAMADFRGGARAR